MAMKALSGRVIVVLERDRPSDPAGSLLPSLVGALGRRGAAIEVVRPASTFARLDIAPRAEVVLLKSGEPVALHLAAAWSAWGSITLNAVAATRLAQDRIATALLLRSAGLPVPPVRAVWVARPEAPLPAAAITYCARRAVYIKSRRGSGGRGLWRCGPGHANAADLRLPEGAYLVMDEIAHHGDDLKVYVAGDWMGSIERRFPATTLTEKRGRPVPVPADVADVARAVGRLLGLRLFGCDFVRSTTGWQLVDVNAFPGYKGLDTAAERIADVVEITADVRATNDAQPIAPGVRSAG